MRERICYLIFSEDAAWSETIQRIFEAAIYSLPIITIREEDELVEYLSLNRSVIPELVLVHSQISTTRITNLVQRIRTFSYIPVLVVEGIQEEGHERFRKDTNDIVQILIDGGADAYIHACPSSELVARAQVPLRRYRQQPFLSTEWIRFENLEMDCATRRAWIGRREVVLTPQLFDLLAHFAINRGRVISHRELGRAIERENWSAENGRAAMKRLRRLIEPYEWILTNVHATGYVLIPPSRRSVDK